MTLLTINECAELVGLSPAWLTQLCKKGEIKHTKQRSRTGKISLAVLEEDLMVGLEQYRQRPGRGVRLAPAVDLPKCPRCGIVLELAPEGYSGEMCNVCVMDLERINGNSSNLQN